MLPGNGSVVAGNSGSPQFENGAGSIPLSGHGGAGGWSLPTGANTCCCQMPVWVSTSLEIVGMRIGLAAAVLAQQASATAATAASVRNARPETRTDMWNLAPSRTTM